MKKTTKNHKPEKKSHKLETKQNNKKNQNKTKNNPQKTPLYFEIVGNIHYSRLNYLKCTKE